MMEEGANTAEICPQLPTTGIVADMVQPMRRRVIDELRDRMVSYEAASRTAIAADMPWIVRIDGHKFSNWTRHFERPADARVHTAFVHTAEDLLVTFGAVTAYTQSDEITLVFAPTADPIFGGNVQKIVSVMASAAGVRFNYHMLRADYPADSMQRKRIESASAHFDARVFNVPSPGEAYNNLLWRSSFDCRRNSVYALARTRYSARQLHGLGTTAIIERLRTEHDVDWEQWPMWFRYGTFVKKEVYTRTLNDTVQGEGIVARSRPAARTLRLGPYNEVNIAMVMAKYWVN